MGCQSCWDYYYRQQKEQYIKARLERGNEVRKKGEFIPIKNKDGKTIGGMLPIDEIPDLDLFGE